MSKYLRSRSNIVSLFNQLELIDRLIIIFLSICFIFPLTLPNWLNFGYNEVILNGTARCDFLSTKLEPLFLDNSYNNNKTNKANLSSIKVGGKYINHKCKTNQNIAIIVPYRNRSEHLQVFLRYMHQYLVKQNAINYQIFVIEQNDQSPFNRATLLNIGFFESIQLNSDLNCFIFHDVDILPLDVRQFYTCSETPRHLCSYLDKFRFVLIYPNLFGGVVAIQKDQFIKVNGYSNMYKGWGGEDDDFYQRIKHHFGRIERYSKEIGRCVMKNHHQYELINHDRSHLLKNVIDRSYSDGLSNLKQTYNRNQVELNPLYVKINVDLRL